MDTKHQRERPWSTKAGVVIPKYYQVQSLNQLKRKRESFQSVNLYPAFPLDIQMLNTKTFLPVVPEGTLNREGHQITVLYCRHERFQMILVNLGSGSTGRFRKGFLPKIFLLLSSLPPSQPSKGPHIPSHYVLGRKHHRSLHKLLRGESQKEKVADSERCSSEKNETCEDGDMSKWAW